MKGPVLILISFLSLRLGAQSISQNAQSEATDGLYGSAQLFASGFYDGNPSEANESTNTLPVERSLLNNLNLFTQPSAPLLTTNPAELEICTGNSTRLTASSNNQIYWYLIPPPLGLPVGTGTSYITPVLTTGYYTFYAVADNNGIKSDISSMEVVMVYPSPLLSIMSSTDKLCANESATLTVSGTTRYVWESGLESSELVIQPEETRTYKVTGINTAGCRNTAYYIQLVTSCSDQQLSTSRSFFPPSDKEKNLQFSVYPNPNTGVFHVQAGSLSESTKVEVYNAIGQIAYSRGLISESSTVDITDFPKGIYIVRIVENNQVLTQQKVVKE